MRFPSFLEDASWSFATESHVLASLELFLTRQEMSEGNGLVWQKATPFHVISPVLQGDGVLQEGSIFVITAVGFTTCGRGDLFASI